MPATRATFAGLIDWDWKRYNAVEEFFLDEDERLRREEYRAQRHAYEAHIQQKIRERRNLVLQKELEAEQTAEKLHKKHHPLVVEDSQEEDGDLDSSDPSDQSNLGTPIGCSTPQQTPTQTDDSTLDHNHESHQHVEQDKKDDHNYASTGINTDQNDSDTDQETGFIREDRDLSFFWIQLNVTPVRKIDAATSTGDNTNPASDPSWRPRKIDSACSTLSPPLLPGWRGSDERTQAFRLQPMTEEEMERGILEEPWTTVLLRSSD